MRIKKWLIFPFQQVVIDFELCWKEVVYLCLLACGNKLCISQVTLCICFIFTLLTGLSFVMTVLFRYCAGIVIWLLLATLVIGSLSGSAYLW